MNIYVKTKANRFAFVAGGVSMKTGKPAIASKAHIIECDTHGEVMLFEQVAKLINDKAAAGIKELNLYLPSDNEAIRARQIKSYSKNGGLSGKELKKEICSKWDSIESLRAELVQAWEKLSEAYENAANNGMNIARIAARREANWVRLTPIEGTDGEQILSEAERSDNKVKLSRFIYPGETKQNVGVLVNGIPVAVCENNKFGAGREFTVHSTTKGTGKYKKTLYSVERFTDPHKDKSHSQLTDEDIKSYKGDQAMSVLAYKLLDEVLPSSEEAITYEDESAIV